MEVEIAKVPAEELPLDKHIVLTLLSLLQPENTEKVDEPKEEGDEKETVVEKKQGDEKEEGDENEIAHIVVRTNLLTKNIDESYGTTGLTSVKTMLELHYKCVISKLKKLLCKVLEKFDVVTVDELEKAKALECISPIDAVLILMFDQEPTVQEKEEAATTGEQTEPKCIRLSFHANMIDGVYHSLNEEQKLLDQALQKVGVLVQDDVDPQDTVTHTFYKKIASWAFMHAKKNNPAMASFAVTESDKKDKYVTFSNIKDTFESILPQLVSEHVQVFEKAAGKEQGTGTDEAEQTVEVSVMFQTLRYVVTATTPQDQGAGADEEEQEQVGGYEATSVWRLSEKVAIQTIQVDASQFAPFVADVKKDTHEDKKQQDDVCDDYSDDSYLSDDGNAPFYETLGHTL